MPVKECSLGGKPGYKWGESGKCYTYESGNEAQRKVAEAKAVKQGQAIEARRKQNMAVIVGNMSSLVRKDTLEGRDCYVVPVIMMTEGVHYGSDGPVLYTSEELSKFPEVWDGKPVVIYHPDEQGTPISACSKTVFDRQKAGVLMNTYFEDGKLKSEVWLDILKANMVDSRIIDALERGIVLEVSTGLYSDQDIQLHGTWNGEQYDKIAKSIWPDHLAILPDQIGACSVADGAGMPRLNQQGKRTDHRLAFLANSISSDPGFYQIAEMLRQKLLEEVGDPDHAWVEEIYLDRFIYVRSDRPGKYYLRKYRVDTSGGVEIAPPSEDVEVEKEVDFVILSKKEEKEMGQEKSAQKSEETPKAPVSNTQESAVPKTLEEFLETTPEQWRDELKEGVRIHREQRTQLVQNLVANERCQFTPAELNGMGLTELRKLTALAEVPAEEKNEENQQEAEAETQTQEEPKPKANYSAQGPTGNAAAEEPLVAPTLDLSAV